MSEYTKGRLCIVERPEHSPHRMFLRGRVSEGWPQGGCDIYHIQERKSGAGRGMEPTWQGFDETAVAYMRRLVACWNACEGLPTSVIEASNLSADIDAMATAQSDRAELIEALRTMLLSADCSWEERNEGHDWPEACQNARALLAKHPAVVPQKAAASSS